MERHSLILNAKYYLNYTSMGIYVGVGESGYFLVIICHVMCFAIFLNSLQYVTGGQNL